MQYMQFTAVRADTGASLPLARVTVYLTGTSTKASLFDNVGGAISNPVTASTIGLVSFAAADGVYDVAIQSADGLYNTPLMVGVQIYDLAAIAAAVALIPGKANLASPIFTGVPAAPTASAGTNTTQLATTAFVTSAVGVLTSGADAGHNTFLKIQNLLVADEATAAALAVTVGGKLTAASNLSDLTNTTTARSNLGVRIGIDVQAFSTPLAALSSGAIWAAGVQVPVFTAAGTVVMKTVGTSSGNLLDKAAGDALYAPIGSTGGVSNGTYGDIVVTLGGTVWTVGPSTITYAKIQNAAAAGLMGATAAGVFGLIPLGAGLVFSGGSLVCTVSGSTTYDIQTRTALAAISSPANGTGRYLAEAGREGWFIFNSSNLSTQVTNDPGQGVYVPPAAATTGASGAWVRVWYDALNVKSFGATGDGTTNDTTAIQRAINLAVTLNVAKIYLPAGVYIVTNLTIPAYSVSAGNQLKDIEFVGYAHPSILFGTAGSGYTMSTSGSILKSSATTGGAILTVTPSAGTFSFYHLICRNLLFRTYDNAQIGAIDASQAENVTLENIGVDTGTYSVSIASAPTNTTSAIKLAKINNACFNYLRNVSVSGYYCGIECEEHTNADNIFLTACSYALFLNASFHAMDFGRLCIQNCVHGPTVVGAVRFTIRQLDLEHATSGWQQTLEDFRDVSLSGSGKIYWASTIAGTGAAGGFTKNGGTGVYCVPIALGTDERKSLFYGTGTTTVPDSTDTYLAFTSTYCASGLQVNGTDNTHIDCLEAGTFSFAARAAFPANGTGLRAISIIKNGTNVIDGDSKPSAGASDPTRVKAVRLFVDMAVGDYVRVAVKQTSGGSLALPRNTDDSGHLEAVMTGPLV